MSHSQGIPLANFTMAAEESDGLLIRVVSVNDDDRVTFPVRELWARRNTKSRQIEYTLSSTNDPYDDQEESFSLEEANDALRNDGGPWLRSLGRMSPIGFVESGGWLVASLVRTQPSIWKYFKFYKTLSDTCYIIDEKNLGAWLDEGGDSAEEDDDDAAWDCISSHGSAEEEFQSEVMEVGSDEEMGSREDEVMEDEAEDEAMFVDDGVNSEASASNIPWCKRSDHWKEGIDGVYGGDVSSAE